MKSKIHSNPFLRHAIAPAVWLFALGLGHAQTTAGPYYWDVNGTTAGSGVTNGSTYTWNRFATGGQWALDNTGTASTSAGVAFNGWSTPVAVNFVSTGDAGGKSYTVRPDGGNMYLSSVNVNSGNLTIDLVNNPNFTFQYGNAALTVADGSSLVIKKGSTSLVGLAGRTLVIDIQGAATASVEGFNGNNNGNSALTKNGTGSLTINGASTYTGATTVSNGTLLATTATALPGYNLASKVSVANGATLAVRAGGSGEWLSTEIDSVLGATTNAFASGSTLGIDVTTGNSFNYANNIGAAQPAKGLVKSGAGTLTLTGANTYGGATTVNGGTLSIDSTGTINSTSSVSIGVGEFSYNSATALSQGVSFSSTGGTLSGAGTITPAVTVSAGNTLAPGSVGGIGTLSTGATAIAGTYACDLDAAASDGLAVTGALDLTGSSLAVNALATPVATTYTIATSTTGVSGSFTGLAEGAILTISGVKYTISYAAAGGNQVTLTKLPPYYWDVNGTTAGSGVTNGSTYTWNRFPTGGQWALDNTGTSSTSAGVAFNNWQNPIDVEFVSTGDAGGKSYTVRPDGGNMYLSSLTVNSGNLTIDLGGNPNFTFEFGNAALTVADGSSLVIKKGSTSLVGLGGRTLAIDIQGAATASVEGFSGGGNSAVTKNGTGSLTINAASTYNGATTVNDGKLSIGSNGTINSTSSVSIGEGEFSYNSATALSQSVSFSSTGGTLSGTGTIPAITVSSDNTLAPGSVGGIGTLSTGDSTIEGTYACDLDAAASDGLAVTGALDLPGATLAINALATPAAATYTIATCTTGITGSFTGLDEGATLTISGVNYTISYAAGGGNQVTLTKVAASGYSSWADANGATGQTVNQDHDNDGVKNGIEYFMGASGSGFTALPALNASNNITWTMGDTFNGVYGTDYQVQTSGDLTIWAPVAVGDVTIDNTAPGKSVSYTLTGSGKRFVRLLVNPN